MKNTRISLKTENGKWCVNNGDIEIAFDTLADAAYFIDLCYRAVR
jgi:predicted transport protein